VVIVHELSRADARRIAVRAQLLDAGRPAGLAVPFDREMTAAVQEEITDLAKWLGLDVAPPG
jgi:hypothetical protein